MLPALQYTHIIYQYINMINTTKLAIATLLILSAVCIRQSDIGVNDWARENIGKLLQISFQSSPPSSHSHSSSPIFFHSQLGVFGQLNKKTGELATRETVLKSQHILSSTQKQLVLLTSSGQIVKYNKNTMHRTVDNRFTLKQYKQINSYLNANNKIYIAFDKFIQQYQTNIKNSDQLLTVNANEGYRVQKMFTQLIGQIAVIHVITYSQSKQQLCINVLSQNQKVLNVKNCVSNIKLTGDNKYYKIYEKSGEIYFGSNQSHNYYNIIENKHKIINSKPINFYQHGALLQNGLLFSAKGSQDQKLIQAKVSGMNNNKIVYGQLTSTGYINLYTSDNNKNKKGQKVASFSLGNSRQGKIYKIWVNFVTQTELQIIIQFSDLQLVYYSLSNKQYRQMWNRQQSLAYINKILFMKYEGYTDHLNNQYHMKMDDPQYFNLSLSQRLSHIPQNIAIRVKTELQDIYNSVVQKLQNIKQLLAHPQSFAQLLDIKTYMKSSMSSQKEKAYGLRKYIIVITQYNTMFAMDTKTSQIIWKKKYGNDKDYKLITLIKLKQQYEKEIAIAINYKYHITYITQIHEDGTATQLAEYQTYVEPTIHKISAHSIVIKGGQKIYRYDINKQLFGSEKQYNFYSVEENRKVIGWKINSNGEESVQTWSIELPQSQKIIKSAAVYRGQPQANLPLSNDKKVVFKNVDFSNLAVLTMQQYIQQTGSQKQSATKIAHRLHIYIINGLTGTIQFSEYQTGINPNLPINLVYDEHNVIVSYYNMRNRVYEIWSIEAFQIVEQNDLLSKKYQPLYQKQDIIFRSKVYGTTIPIKYIYVSESKQALLRRNLIIITRQNKLYMIARELISTRRPKSSNPDENALLPQAEFIQSKYPPQQYILPINPLAYLNYNRKMSNLEHIRFSSSDLQSTIFVMAYGVDMFLLRNAPDKAFDLLADGFNYLQLVAVLVLVTVAAVFFKGKMNQAKLRKSHLQ